MKKFTALIAMLFVAAIVSAITVIGPYTATMQFGLNRQSRIDFVDADNSISEKVIFEETGSGKTQSTASVGIEWELWYAQNVSLLLEAGTSLSTMDGNDFMLSNGATNINYQFSSSKGGSAGSSSSKTPLTLNNRTIVIYSGAGNNTGSAMINLVLPLDNTMTSGIYQGVLRLTLNTI